MSEVTAKEVLDAMIQLDQKLDAYYIKLDARLKEIERKTEARILYTKTLTPPIIDPLETGEPTIINKLRDAGIEPLGLLSVDPTQIKPIRFLADRWGPVNDVLTTNGWIWVRDGRNSRWEPNP